MLSEFKQFILKGNVIDLSTGVIIGASFNSIVTAFTKGIIEPILAIFGGVEGATELKIKILEKTVTAVEKVDGVEKTIQKVVPVFMDIGGLIGAILGFLITAAVVFFVIIKPTNKLLAMMKREEKKDIAATAPPAVAEEVRLLTEIRDALKTKGGQPG